jgi:hypothetical protein
MAYKIKQTPRTDLQDYAFRNSNQKKEDIFAVPKTEIDTDEDIFKQDENEDDYIKELNADLYTEQIPIEIKNKEVLLVNAQGKIHEITRQDLAEYQRLYAYEGQDGRDITGFRKLGGISGNYESLDKIAQDITSTFNKLDEKQGGYNTSPQED